VSEQLGEYMVTSPGLPVTLEHGEFQPTTRETTHCEFGQTWA